MDDAWSGSPPEEPDTHLVSKSATAFSAHMSHEDLIEYIYICYINQQPIHESGCPKFNQQRSGETGQDFQSVSQIFKHVTLHLCSQTLSLM